jgi:hypothetical protein
MHEYIVFPLYFHSPISYWYSPLRKGLFYLPVLFLEKKKDISIYLRWLYREFHCDISVYICIITWISSSLYFSPFYLSPLLMVISTGLKIIYIYIYFFFFLLYWGLNSGLSPWPTPPAQFFFFFLW